MARVITVTSGKGGVGKTNISVNLALYLSARGYRTCLFDADLGLANINILLGIYPEYNLKDVLSNEKSMKDIMVRNCHGIDIIPGSSGVEMMADLEYEQIDPMVKSFSQLDDYDFLIFDTSAGISKNVISFCMASSEIILVVTPEPTSLTDAYALLKVLSLNGFSDSAMIIVNQCKNPQIAKIAYTKLRETVQKFLRVKIVPLGTIVSDPSVVEAVKKQKPFMSLYPSSNAARCIKNIAENLLKKDLENFGNYGLETFWTRCLKLLKSPLQLPSSKSEKRNGNKTATPIKPPPETIPSSDTPDQSSAAPSPNCSEIADMGNLVLEIQKLSGCLMEHLSSITKELSAIRKVLEDKEEIRHEESRFTENTDKDESTVIPLDFEAFLKRRKNN
jgi:flagellar biosynthesis protein FlhG